MMERPDIKLNPKNRQFQFVAEDTDLADARMFQEMMDTKGWKRLMQYASVGREELLILGKTMARSKKDSDKSSEAWAMLDGFDQALNIPNVIIARVQEYIDKNREIKEEKIDANAE